MRSRVPLEGEDRSRSVCPVLASVLSDVFFFFSSVSCPRSSGARFSQFLGPSQVTPSYSTRSIELSSLSFLNSLDRGISIERTRPTCCSCCLIPPDSLHLSESTADFRFGPAVTKGGEGCSCTAPRIGVLRSCRP